VPHAGLSFGFVTVASRSEVEALEALPIDSLWVGGHVSAPQEGPEAMGQLARLAGLARRTRVGTSILLLPLYPPAIVAKQLADIDHVTGGRVSLGIGVGGEYPQEFRACEIPLAERGARADEAIPLLRRLWSGEEISHAGRFHRLERVSIRPAPLQPGGPPILVAGRQEVAMRRAALLGDGWMPYLYSPRRYAQSHARIRDVAGAAGRGLDGFEWLHFLVVNVNDDAERARRDAAASLGAAYNQDFNAMLDSVAAVGNAAQVAARVGEFIAAGARHVIFGLAAGRKAEDEPARIAMAQKIAHQVIPLVHAQFAADSAANPPSMEKP
jgi:alkanesulfonate monooxygenase SsuD/methylene tetrahydromethanopterin reductase-like flavin-dependent oxidoreductase (luciferase family)